MESVLGKLMVGTAFLFAAASVVALESDEVRGTLTEVSENPRQITLRVEETGDDTPERIGVDETYDVTSATDIRFALSRVYGGLTDAPLSGYEDLEPGQEVVLDFRQVGDRREAGTVVRAEDYDATGSERLADVRGPGQQDRERIRTAQAGQGGEMQRDRLPDTASFQPLWALTGLAFIAIALGLRISRR